MYFEKTYLKIGKRYLSGKKDINRERNHMVNSSLASGQLSLDK